MQNRSLQPKAGFIFLGVLQVFNAASGLYGGSMLIRDPGGTSLNLSLEWLKGTPFTDFLIPGIVLFTFIGVGHLLAAVLSIRRSERAVLAGLALGTFLVVWIVIQVTLIGYQNFLQPLYFILGVVELITGIILNKSTAGQTNRTGSFS